MSMRYLKTRPYRARRLEGAQRTIWSPTVGRQACSQTCKYFFFFFVILHLAYLHSRSIVGLLTDGHSGNRSRSFQDWGKLCAAWRTACIMGAVVGPLSPHSILPFVVSRAEAERRLAAWRQEETLRQWRQGRESAAAMPSPVVPTGIPPTEPPPTDVDPDENGPVAESSAADAEPKAWVVLRGVHPGVFYTR